MSSKGYTLLASLVPRMQAIRVSAGYSTDAGKSVLMGPVPKQSGEAYPFCRLHETDATPESAVPFRPSAKMRVQFVAEAYAEQSDAAQVVETGHTLIADLKKALFGDAMRDLNGQAIDARLEGYAVQYPESGSNVVIGTVRGSFSFHDDFTAL